MLCAKQSYANYSLLLLQLALDVSVHRPREEFVVTMEVQEVLKTSIALLYNIMIKPDSLKATGSALPEVCFCVCVIVSVVCV